MKDRFRQAIDYVTEHRQLVSTSVIALIGIGTLIALFVYNQPVVYEPTTACNLLTPAKAMDALGNKVIQTGDSKPSASGDIATSKCGYTDENSDKDQMAEVSVAVQSAINDKGITQNKSNFSQHRSLLSSKAKTVNNLGDSAYYDMNTGYLNILDGKRWIMVSYGTGQKPDSKPMADVVALAHAILK